ncbi:MAG: bacillithiol biosynthesis BshC [Bacillota bacterium]|nr:bacillithiol biosynthesis BshC [Bacillota bacterium]
MVVPTQDSIDRVLTEMESNTPDSDYKPQVMEILREKSYEPGSLGKWFMKMMSAFFARHGLLFFDPIQASRSGLYTSLLLQVLEEGSLIHEQIAKQDGKIIDGGFPLQAGRTGQESFIMIIWNGRRYALNREKERFVTRGRELSVSRKELQEMIRQEPQRFSPNVFLRPVFQDRLFPNLTYVPGPGELAYFAQISGVYELFGLTMPPLNPRLGVTLVDPEIVRSHTSAQSFIKSRLIFLRVHKIINYLNILFMKP